ncbi:hypothetical protein QQS45_08500 [Alteriqipengyuania flavescens]|uniref:hypothetical protein n=1 Tax=Alteriqipengyuania flavescens TaxID=3053610 RepID=UPI0025B36724|nr:hypothetical protein [Alteriqipengyuania flavescens]WJY17687.1 hypothetical protein QQW98_08495 [Alteriqipengyuania flavescens]WJY23630.1 hypothetical protein QQS45_08500 [Alteriqipengyuania flavescens]
MTLNTLNASRKADREKLFAALSAVAEQHGATVDRHDSPRIGGHGASITFIARCNGVGAMVYLNRLFGGGLSLISWFNDHSGDRSLPTKHFAGGFRVAADAGSSDPRPHHKATTSGQDWDHVAACLDEGLALAAAREAFVEDCEARAYD